jgi:Fur family ferric uptake transcriptional regulator
VNTAGAAGTEAELRARLHERGLRLTPQRALVLDAVARLGHATPDAIGAEVQRIDPNVNISTVYRTLELLEELGLVRHAHLGPGAATYHPADDHAHLHLVCHGCGRVTEAEVGLAAELAGRVRASHGFTVDVEHMAISGWCPACPRR